MAESIAISREASKEDIYRELLPQIKSIIAGESNLVANLANVAAILDEAFSHLWTGFYLSDDDGKTLVLGPFQGPLACTRIPLEPVARGVCGAAAEQQKTQLVPDVEAFPGHIACSSASKSEIVVPLISGGKTRLVLDVDSASLSTFDLIDQKYLEELIELIKQQHFPE